MPSAANIKRILFATCALAGVLIAAAVVIYAFRSDSAEITRADDGLPRPAAGTPRGVIWDLWHAAMADDRDTVRAAFHATTEAERRAADALAELLVAEARFARQLRHTWPMSPTSRDGAGTWFGEAGDTALFAARESIDPAAVHATVIVQGTPVKLTRAAGAWKIEIPTFVRTKLKRAATDDTADVDLAVAAEQFASRAQTYHDLTREVAALRLPSPAVAMEQLRRELPPATTRAS